MSTICITVLPIEVIQEIIETLSGSIALLIVVRYHYGYDVVKEVSESILKFTTWYVLAGWALILATSRILYIILSEDMTITMYCIIYTVIIHIAGVLITTWIGKKLFGMFHLAGYGVFIGLFAGDDIGIFLGSQIIKWLG